MAELPCRLVGGLGQGADEHRSERTPLCVSDGAQSATQASAVSGAASR
jgi:hypothetical protein